MEINPLLYFSCLLVLPIGTNTTVPTAIRITATLPAGKKFIAWGKYSIEGTGERYMVDIRIIYGPPNVKYIDLMEILKDPLTAMIIPDGPNQTSFAAKLLGNPKIYPPAGIADGVRILCETISNLVIVPAVHKCPCMPQGGGLLVVTNVALFKFMLRSVGTNDSKENFNLSLSSEEFSSYAGLTGILFKFWDSGSGCGCIKGEHLTPIEVTTADNSNLTVVIKQDVEIHLLLYLKNGNIILLDAFKRDSNEIWIFEGCLTTKITKGKKVLKKKYFDSYVKSDRLSDCVVRLHFAPSKHGDMLGSTGDIIEISKLKIERPQQYGDLLTILKCE